VAEIVRARYKGKDTGEGLPYLHGIPARDLTDDDFDLLDDERKQMVRSHDLYDYTPYTEKPRGGAAKHEEAAPAKSEKAGEGK